MEEEFDPLTNTKSYQSSLTALRTYERQGQEYITSLTDDELWNDNAQVTASVYAS